MSQKAALDAVSDALDVLEDAYRAVEDQDESAIGAGVPVGEVVRVHMFFPGGRPRYTIRVPGAFGDDHRYRHVTAPHRDGNRTFFLSSRTYKDIWHCYPVA